MRVLITTDSLGAACRTNLLHFFSCDALISVYSHVIGPRCEVEIDGFIQYVNMAPISWLYTHPLTGHTHTHTRSQTQQWLGLIRGEAEGRYLSPGG